ncbi:MAG: hypothetical protein ACJ75G_02945 [Gaiellaceae bacterium]
MQGPHMGRGLRGILALLAVGLVATAIPAAGGKAAHAASSTACAAKGDARLGQFGGVVGAVPVDAPCVGTSDGHNGLPPLLWHGGPMMGTPATGPVVVTPIFWNPAGHPMTASYKTIITDYLTDVAADSGQHTNVYSTLDEYFGSNGSINYDVQLGAPVDDTRPLPANGCDLTHKDMTGIYADGSGYDACLDDAQVAAETDAVRRAQGKPADLAHIYVLFLPKHVETCFLGGSVSTLRKGNQLCTINHEKSAGYCAYHTMAPTGMVYANLSFPIYRSPVGFTCGSDARVAFGVVQTPNGDPDADTEVSPTSHEIMEAITDPDVSTGWYDQAGFENGDECAYVFGTPQGAAGQFYNQVINGDNYLTQEEFSNLDFFATGLGCLPSE